MKYANIREEELKNKVAQDFFEKFDATEIINNIDFSVKLKASADSIHFSDEYLLWAEAKNTATDILIMLTQLVLTIGKARTFDKILPPLFLGCFDCEKIAFVPYADIQEIFYLNDFNWKVAPSNQETNEFKQVKAHIEAIINNEDTYIFDFLKDEKELKRFIEENFIVGKTKTSKIKIDKNNFIVIFNRWLEVVKPTISYKWEAAKKSGVISGDFYLADLLSDQNTTLRDNLYVVLNATRYEMNLYQDEYGAFISGKVDFTDKQQAHSQFWAKYERPPYEEYWDYIVERRDLLVPQDVRERKGSFFTPKKWVELSQKYIADFLGKDWQDEYYVWDCAAGTGNLLAGLTNKYNIWASTLDKADVDVMKDRIRNGANLLEDHVFQFDFLNDNFDKLPKRLLDIINDEEERKKLIIYINPPYAEVSSKDIQGKVGVNQTNIHKIYTAKLGTAGRELYAQFLVRIYYEIGGAILAEFSKLKILQGSAFENFRQEFKAKLEKIFLAPANTFDNVKGSFPIGFKIWNTKKKEVFTKLEADVFDADGNFIETKMLYAFYKQHYINSWISLFKADDNDAIGYMDGINGNDFQHNNIVYILNNKKQCPNPRGIWINQNNIIPVSIYFAVRKCIAATWLNDRDQFLKPNDSWKKDLEFQNDCFTYLLFNNNIQSKYGVNNWIPFSEKEINARGKFDSNFMIDFIKGKKAKVKTEKKLDTENKTKNIISDVDLLLVTESEIEYNVPRKFSQEAQNVFNAGRELWRYYHTQKFPSVLPTAVRKLDNSKYAYSVDAEGGQGGYSVNASLHDIREHFQGRNEKGKMNNKSDNETYNELIGNLRVALKVLAKKIEPKVFEHGFLRK